MKRRSIATVARSLADCKTIGLAAVLLLVCSAAAAQLVIGPIAVEFGEKQRVAAVAVTLDERAKLPMRLQAEILRWSQDLAGQAVTEETDELLVTPPMAELQPGQRQVFRLALRGKRPAPEELAYRLILEDISESTTFAEVSPGMVINFRMRHDLPVVVAPAGLVVTLLRWKPCPPEAFATAVSTPVKPSAARAAEACVRLLNAGNRRVKVQTLTLAGDGWQQALSLKAGENVLAGAEREWRVPLAKGQEGALRTVQVQTARGETLQAESGDF
jgi:fimbrial chaperone protein